MRCGIHKKPRTCCHRRYAQLNHISPLETLQAEAGQPAAIPPPPVPRHSSTSPSRCCPPPPTWGRTAPARTALATSTCCTWTPTSWPGRPVRLDRGRGNSFRSADCPPKNQRGQIALQMGSQASIYRFAVLGGGWTSVFPILASGISRGSPGGGDAIGPRWWIFFPKWLVQSTGIFLNPKTFQHFFCIFTIFGNKISKKKSVSGGLIRI